MKNPIIKNPTSLIFATVLTVLISAFVFSLIGTFFFALIYDFNVFKNPSLYLTGDYSDTGVVMFLKFVQIFQSIGMFIAPPLLIVFLSRTELLSSLSLKTYPKLFILLIAGTIMITAMPLIDALATFNSKMVFPESLSWLEQWMKQSEENAINITKIFLDVSSISGLLLNLLMIALIPAIGEELMFRGFIQNFFSRRMNVHIAILLSAFIFSAIHFQFYGFLPRFLMGLFFGYLLYWSNSLWIPMFAHFVNNATAVIITYIYGIEKMSSESLVDKDTNFSLIVLSSLFITASFIYIIYKYYASIKPIILSSLTDD